MEPITIGLSIFLFLIAYIIGKINLNEVPDLFDGIERSKKGDPGGIETFIKSIMHLDPLEIAYKTFGGKKFWFYFWGGEISVALIFIISLWRKGTTVTELGLLILFFIIIRSGVLYSSFSGYEQTKQFLKSILPNLLFYSLRVIYYWLSVWIVLYVLGQLTNNPIQFKKTLSEGVISISAQTSFTFAVGLLIFLSLRGYFRELVDRKKEILGIIEEKLKADELDLPRTESDFVQNLVKLEKQMSEDIKGYQYFEREIASLKRTPDYILSFVVFGIYFLTSLGVEKEFTQFLPDKLMFAFFLLVLYFSMFDIKTTLSRGLSD